MQNQPQAVQIQIDIDDTTAQGAYSNLALLTHTETEFVIDFVYIQPQAPKAKVRSRIVMSPIHTKRLLEALKENVKRYEEKVGTIKSQGVPEKEGSEYQGHYL